MRRALRRKLRFVRKRKRRRTRARIWLLLNCRYVLTKKPAENRMGKGKGAISNYVYRVKHGKLLLESTGLSCATYTKIFRKIQGKLPVRTEMVSRLLNV